MLQVSGFIIVTPVFKEQRLETPSQNFQRTAFLDNGKVKCKIFYTVNEQISKTNFTNDVQRRRLCPGWPPLESVVCLFKLKRSGNTNEGGARKQGSFPVLGTISDNGPHKSKEIPGELAHPANISVLKSHPLFLSSFLLTRHSALEFGCEALFIWHRIVTVWNFDFQENVDDEHNSINWLRSAQIVRIPFEKPARIDALIEIGRRRHQISNLKTRLQTSYIDIYIYIDLVLA